MFKQEDEQFIKDGFKRFCVRVDKLVWRIGYAYVVCDMHIDKDTRAKIQEGLGYTVMEMTGFMDTYLVY